MPIRTDPTARPESATAFPGPVASPGRPSARPAPRRADPTSVRLAVAAGGIATVSALLAAVGGAAIPAATAAAAPLSGGTAQSTVRYIYVPSGQTTPSVGVATSIAAPAPLQVQAPVVTRQSGARP